MAVTVSNSQGQNQPKFLSRRGEKTLWANASIYCVSPESWELMTCLWARSVSGSPEGLLGRGGEGWYLLTSLGQVELPWVGRVLDVQQGALKLWVLMTCVESSEAWVI